MKKSEGIPLENITGREAEGLPEEPPMSFLQRRMQHILNDRPLPEKKTYRLKPVSDKRKEKLAALKPVIDPNEYFSYHMKHSIPVCENCGMEASWLLDPQYEKVWRACHAHVLPKKKEYGFPSLRNNLENHLVLMPSFGGKLCGCHGWFDSSWFNASTMSIWPKAVQVFIDLYPQIPQNERKNIPEVFLPYIK